MIREVGRNRLENFPLFAVTIEVYFKIRHRVCVYIYICIRRFVLQVNPGSKAAQQGVREGDLISSINGRNTSELTNGEAHTLLRNVGDQLNLGLNQ